MRYQEEVRVQQENPPTRLHGYPLLIARCIWGMLVSSSSGFFVFSDPHTGLLYYANAGHDLPYRHAPGSAIELQARGMPLGLMPDMDYEEQQILLQSDESVVFYSDGLVEAHNAASDMFGFPRLASLLGEQSAQANAIQFLLGQLQTFTGPRWEQEDDITLVTLPRDLLFIGSSCACVAHEHHA